MRILSTILLLAAGLLTCQAAPRELVIFHTNDIHGHFTAERAGWRKDHALVGGVDALALHLRDLRKQYPRSIYLDAGDLMTGNPICNLEYNGVKGGALPEFLNRCGIAAECLGNHEFDLGAKHLRDYVAAAPYPILCANLFDNQTNRDLTATSRIFDEDGLRVGVIGLIMNNLGSVASRTALSPFRVEDAVETAQKYIDELHPKVDLVVLLTHEGVEDDSALATRIHGANVIVGGHSHTRLEAPKKVNGVVIVQAGSYLQNLGVLDLQVDGDSVVSYTGRLEELTLPANPAKTDVSTLADSFEVAIQAQYGQVIGELAQRWVPGYYDGSNVGNWICDHLRARYNADVAFVNAGGIRAPIEAGPVTPLNIQQLLPFVNSIVTFDASGADLLKVAEEQARARGLHKHGSLEMSGMTVKYSIHDSTATVAEAIIAGEPVQPGKSYRVVSMDYVILSQWREYLSFEPKNVQTTSDLISDVVSDEIRKAKGPITSDSTPRLVEVH
jgi:2',3'-cyclic-nucleotide 2'-phosphodiesterase (5'-nucleotidase family)